MQEYTNTGRCTGTQSTVPAAVTVKEYQVEDSFLMLFSSTGVGKCFLFFDWRYVCTHVARNTCETIHTDSRTYRVAFYGPTCRWIF